MPTSFLAACPQQVGRSTYAGNVTRQGGIACAADRPGRACGPCSVSNSFLAAEPQQTRSTHAGKLTRQGSVLCVAGRPGHAGGHCSAPHSRLAAWPQSRRSLQKHPCRQINTAGRRCLRAGPVWACRWGVPAGVLPTRQGAGKCAGLCWGVVRFGPLRHHRAAAAGYEAAGLRCF